MHRAPGDTGEIDPRENSWTASNRATIDVENAQLEVWGSRSSTGIQNCPEMKDRCPLVWGEVYPWEE